MQPIFSGQMWSVLNSELTDWVISESANGLVANIKCTHTYEKRLCDFCEAGCVENEHHLIFECSLYVDARSVLIDLSTGVFDLQPNKLLDLHRGFTL